MMEDGSKKLIVKSVSISHAIPSLPGPLFSRTKNGNRNESAGVQYPFRPLIPTFLHLLNNHMLQPYQFIRVTPDNRGAENVHAIAESLVVGFMAREVEVQEGVGGRVEKYGFGDAKGRLCAGSSP